MNGLSWDDADTLARGEFNQAIRQDDWHHWLIYDPNTFLWFMWWPELTPEASDWDRFHVVQAAEFGVDQFRALNWTNEPWDSSVLPISTSGGRPIYPRPRGVSYDTYVETLADASPVIDSGVPATVSYTITQNPDPNSYYSYDPDLTDDATVDETHGGEPYDPTPPGNVPCWVGPYPDTIDITIVGTSGGGISGRMGTLTVGIEGDTISTNCMPGGALSFTKTIPFVVGGSVSGYVHYRQEVPVPPYAGIPDAHVEPSYNVGGACPP